MFLKHSFLKRGDDLIIITKTKSENSVMEFKMNIVFLIKIIFLQFKNVNFVKTTCLANKNKNLLIKKERNANKICRKTRQSSKINLRYIVKNIKKLKKFLSPKYNCNY